MFRYTPFDMSPWRVLDELMDVDRRLNRALQATADKASGRFPRVNLYKSDDGIIVDVAVPGIPHDAVDVSIDGRKLNVGGKIAGKDEFSFSRSVELPFPVSEDDAKAVFNRGMLRITLPKAPEAKPRRIAITQG